MIYEVLPLVLISAFFLFAGCGLAALIYERKKNDLASEMTRRVQERYDAYVDLEGQVQRTIAHFERHAKEYSGILHSQRQQIESLTSALNAHEGVGDRRGNSPNQAGAGAVGWLGQAEDEPLRVIEEHEDGDQNQSALEAELAEWQRKFEDVNDEKRVELEHNARQIAELTERLRNLEPLADLRLKTEETGFWKRRVEELEAEKRQNSPAVDPQPNEHSSLEDQLAKTEAAVRDWQLRAEELAQQKGAEISELRQRLAQLEPLVSQAAQNDRTLGRALEHGSALERDLVDARTQVDAGRAERQVQATRVGELEQQLVERQSNLVLLTAEREAFVGEVSSLNDRIGAARLDAEAAGRSFAEQRSVLEGRASALRVELDQRSHDLADMQASVRAQRDTWEGERAQWKASERGWSERDAAHSARAEQLERTSAEWKVACEDAQSVMERSERAWGEKHAQLQSELDAASARGTTLDRRCAELESELSSVQSVVAERTTAIEAVNRDLANLRTELDQQTQLHEQAQAAADLDRTRLAADISRLELDLTASASTNHELRARCEVLAEQALAQAQTCERQSSELETLREERTQLTRRLADEETHSREAAEHAAGEMAELHRSLAERARRIEELDALLSEARTSNKNQAEACQRHSHELDTVQSALAKMSQDSESLRSDLRKQEHEYQELFAKYAEMRECAEARGNELAARSGELSTARGEIANLDARIGALEGELASQRGVSLNQKQTIEELMSSLDTTKQDAQKQKQRLLKQATNVEAASQLLDQLRPMIETLESQLEKSSVEEEQT